MDEQKKYVRTFSGDIQTLQEGGKPNLAPFKKPEPLKTYSGDFSDKVKETQASTATIIAAEQDSATQAPKVLQNIPEESSRGNTVYIIVGIVLLVLGSIGAYVAYSSYLVKTEPVIVTNSAFSPIFVDEREKISGTTRTALLQAVKQSLTRPLLPNNVRLLYIDSVAATSSIFSILKLGAPEVLLRNINTARSIAGIVNSNGPTSPLGTINQNPFFILSVTTYGDTFAGMLAWEPTMPQDLNALFPEYPTQSVSTITATTTPKIIKVAPQTPTTRVPVSVFRDEIVSNHDVRIYRDANGKSVLIYGYWNQATLVIARDPSAFVEILDRLATARAE